MLQRLWWCIVHVNGFIDADEVLRTLPGAHSPTRASFLDAVLRDDTPYFVDMAGLKKWLEDNGVSTVTFNDHAVSFW